MIASIPYLLDYNSLFYLVCFAAGLYRFKLLNLADKVVMGIVLQYILIDISIVTLTTREHRDNLFIHNIFNLIKFSLFFFYFFLKSPQKWVRVACVILIPGFLVWGLINYFYVQGVNVFNTLTYIPESFIVGLFSYLNLRRVIITDAISRSNFQLWFLIANCLYFFVNIPIEGMEPYIVKISWSLAYKLRLIPNVFENIWMIMITLGFLWKKPSHI